MVSKSSVLTLKMSPNLYQDYVISNNCICITSNNICLYDFIPIFDIYNYQIVHNDLYIEFIF